MRHQPERVDRVAGEAAAQMIVDAALADVDQRVADRMTQRRRRRWRAPARQSRSRIGACGNLGAPPSPPWIVSNACTSRSAVRARKPGASAGPASGSRRGAASASLSAAVLLVDLVALVAPDLADRCQHLGQPGPAVARFGREVGAAPERLAGRRQEHGERPAALLAEQRQRMLIDLVEVRALLAIDLDVDEVRGSSAPAIAGFSKLSCAITWHQWQAA